MASSKRPKSKTTKNGIEPITVGRGDEIERVIFKGSRKRLDRRDLHVALEPIVRAWLRAACQWDSVAIGDHSFLIFSIDVAPETQVYVQFWSEPMEPMLWEVSSGRWNPPADEWLAGERSQRIEALGFVIGGKADNFHRTIPIDSAGDIAAVAKAVVEIFYEGFDYRGTLPIRAQLVYDGRSEMEATYESFTPEDISKVFAGLGFRVEEAIPDSNEDDEAAPMIRCRKRGTYTVVQFDDRLEDENLYQRVRLAADVELPDDERARLKSSAAAPEGGEPVLTVSVVHAFSGGVTLEWLVARITEWDATLAEHRRLTRRANKVANAAWLNQTVH
ncbi:MAG: hypothetical protein H0W08_13085 [Acidobacteria bacterium]|nr:hypothetical protein [Acidobacteriota bacterium]